MKKTISITASQTTFVISSMGSESSGSAKMHSSVAANNSPAKIGVSIASSTSSLFVADRPIATQKAQETSRLNRSIELGYTVPLNTTKSR